MLSMPISEEAGSERLRAHSPKRAATRNVGRVKDGLSIGSLRATGGPPASALSGTSPVVAAPTGNVSLLDLPASGRSLVASLQAPARDVRPLLFGLSNPVQEGGSVVEMKVLQQRINTMRFRFGQIDNRSRFLQASRNPVHENAWHRVTETSEKFSALG
jgi:hypothetical protein